MALDADGRGSRKRQQRDEPADAPQGGNASKSNVVPNTPDDSAARTEAEIARLAAAKGGVTPSQ